MMKVRVWGFPTSNGGVDYFLTDDNVIHEFGTDDMGNDLDEKMSVEEFLDSVAGQSDYAEIVDNITNRQEARL